MDILTNQQSCLNLVQQIQTRLDEKSRTIATAESCTGGILATLFTHFAGSSRTYLGGISAYSNEVKSGILGVDMNIISSCGAVAEEVCSAMANRTLELFHSDYAISVTGVAGPGGGTVKKPVGLIYLGCAAKTGELLVQEHRLTGDRLANRSEIVLKGLMTLVKLIQK